MESPVTAAHLREVLIDVASFANEALTMHAANTALKTIVLSLMLSLNLSWATSCGADTVTIGQFTAHKTCQAYQSFRKQTNPNSIQLSPNMQYPIIALNKTSAPQWYRLYVKTASPKARWVSAQCGTATIIASSSQHNRQTACNSAGHANSYILALSWQPGFCQNQRNKAECSVRSTQAYQASNFTLHGLWPNKNSCRSHYAFCGQYKKRKKDFTQYDAVPINRAVLQQLSIVMPSTAHHTYLQRHEWHKHGTCQTSWDANDYFMRAINLTRAFNSGEIHRFISKNIGKEVSAQAFFNAVNQTLGANAAQRLQIACHKNILRDIYIHLPQTLPMQTSLKTLIQQASPKFKNRCGPSFTINAIDH